MAQVPRAEKGTKCPFFKKDMSEVCHDCVMWEQFRGVDPQTGAEIDRWDCSIKMQAKCTLSVAQIAQNGLGGVQAATESFRNQMVEQNRQLEHQLLKPPEDK